MDLSADLAHLEQGLREAGPSGPSGRQLRYYLLLHFSELVQHLTCSLESDVQPDPPADADKQPQAATSRQPEGSLLETNSGWIGDPVEDAYQREVRNQAREVFDERSLEGEDYVALWMDAVPVWGRSLVLCMGVTAGGYRHMLGCIEATLQHDAAIRQLLQGLRKRGLCADRGLLCITRGQSWLTRVLEEALGSHLCHQHCQMAKRERVVSYLAEKPQRRVRGAITRAFQLPDRDEAHAALMRIHAELELLNRSAAQWLLQDLEQTLTLHQTGMYELLCSSLRSTRCLVHTASQLFQQMRDLRKWLPPEQRRGQYALMLLAKESRMRRLAHATHLVPMRSELLGEEVASVSQ